MNYADIKNVDVANGRGVRVSLFVSGCTRHCPECFNKEAWDFNYGKPFTSAEEDYIMELLAPAQISGLSLLGGEPLEYSNMKGLLPLLRRVKTELPEKNIWCYTGNTFETDIMKNIYKKWKEAKEFFSYIDVLVDGDFQIENKDLSIEFRGSNNQRILDLQESLKQGKGVNLVL
jgi:anaerobic ribonucleoside-triphosphate reductase activating protein